MKRTWLLLTVALFALALFAPAAMAQDDDADDFGDDDGSARASAPATAAADDGALPEAGGPALLAPVADGLLLAGGAAGALALRRGRDDS